MLLPSLSKQLQSEGIDFEMEFMTNILHSNKDNNNNNNNNKIKIIQK